MLHCRYQYNSFQQRVISPVAIFKSGIQSNEMLNSCTGTFFLLHIWFSERELNSSRLFVMPGLCVWNLSRELVSSLFRPAFRWVTVSRITQDSWDLTIVSFYLASNVPVWESCLWSLSSNQVNWALVFLIIYLNPEVDLAQFKEVHTSLLIKV